MTKLSAVITTFNNARSLEACLKSVEWADELVVLDSFSTDETLDIAARYGCTIAKHTFMGYGPQKQMAIDMAMYDWILLLDADEALSPALQDEIQFLITNNPPLDSYEMPRIEQIFWRMNHPRVRFNHFLRLFDRRKTRMSLMPIHAAPKTIGSIGRLKHGFYHFGEISIASKVARANSYSDGLVADKVAKGKHGNPLIMLFYPPLFFIRLYIFKRNFLNGWAGFIGAAVGAFYVFLKYAKLYEYKQQQKSPAIDPIKMVERKHCR